MRPLLIDLYCCAGGATSGYVRAGFDVIGVDISPQPNYLRSGALGFIEHDAIDLLESWLRGENNYGIELDDIAAFHASPPCQRYSGMTVCRPGLAETYPDLIKPTRKLLRQTGRPFVIENVMGARSQLVRPEVLCMDFFGHPEISRDRLFETSFPLSVPRHGQHERPRARAGRWERGYAVSPVGHFPRVREVREALQVPWMTRDEIAESIPPVMTEFVGAQLLRVTEAGQLALAA